MQINRMFIIEVHSLVDAIYKKRTRVHVKINNSQPRVRAAKLISQSRWSTSANCHVHTCSVI